MRPSFFIPHFSFFILLALALCGCESLVNAQLAQDALKDRSQDDNVKPQAEYLDLTKYTLPELVDFAATNRPSMVQAYLEVESARLAMKSIAADAPVISSTPWNAASVDVGLNYGEQSTPKHSLKSSTRQSSPSASLSLDLLIWDWGRNDYAAKAQAERIVAQELALIDEGYSVFEDVTLTFLDLLTADANLEIAHTNVVLNAVLYDRAQRRFNAGEVNQLAVIQAKKSKVQAEEKLIEAANAGHTASSELVKAMGLDASRAGRDDIINIEHSPLTHADPLFPATTITLQEAYDFALTNAPSILIAKAKLRAASHEVDVAKADLMPKLSMSGSINWTDPLWYWSWAANLTQNLFAGFRNTTALDQAVNDMQLAAVNLDEAEQQLSRDLAIAIANRDDARAASVSAAATLDAARENYETVCKQYEVGSADYLDYNDAANTLVEALGTVVSAFYIEQKEEASLYRLMGKYPVYLKQE